MAGKGVWERLKLRVDDTQEWRASWSPGCGWLPLELIHSLGVAVHCRVDPPSGSHCPPDILECEVKWALGSMTTKKPSGDDGIPVELFQILKDDAVKVLHSICQQIWKT